MSNNLNYVPSPNAKHKEYKKILFLMLFIILIIVIYFMFFQQKENIHYVDYLSQYCDIDNKGFAKGEEEIIQDYGFYGESLTLFSKPYSLRNKDSFFGKVILVRNICNGQVNNFFIGKELDANINLATLSKGLYEFLLVDGLNNKPILFDADLDVKLELVRNDNQIRLVNTYIYPNNSNTKRLLLIIEDGENIEKSIMINPISDNPSEREIKIVNDLKKDLETNNYKVVDSFVNGKYLDYHGEKGVLDLAKKLGVKYLINIKASDELLLANSNYSIITSLGKERVYKRILDQYFDYNDLIRESGGYLLGSGLVKNQLVELNRWNKDNRRGINTLNMYINDSNLAISLVHEWLK